MDTVRRISVPALRILTRTILIKAVISAVLFICAAAAGIYLLSGAPDTSAIWVACVIAQTAGFVNAVAAVLCLGGVTALSARITGAYRAVTAALIVQCLVLLLVTMIMYLPAADYQAAAAVVRITLLALIAAERLLIGAAFLFLAKSFDGTGRIGTFYFYYSIAGIILPMAAIRAGDAAFMFVVAAVCLAGAVLELLMYRQISEAAFSIWRKLAFNISDQQDG